MGAITHRGTLEESEGSASHLKWKEQTSKSSLSALPD